MMAFRGVHLSYETIRRWCDTFGASYAAKLKRRRPKLGDRWFLDQVFLACTAPSRGARHPPCSFPPQTTFTFCRELSSRKAASIRDMAGYHRSLTSAWNTTPARSAAALTKRFKPIQRLSHRNVTVP